jgi:polyferredoxin
MKTISKKLISSRMSILSLMGISLYVLISWYGFSLWHILLIGVVTGIVFGKVFCRWLCPMGLIMELLLGLSPGGKVRQMYMYHKLGCPIAWISGWLNKFSLFRIKLSADSCKNCGACDKVCYIASLEPEKYSLYKPDKQRPGESYTCSKCLACVGVCNHGSLKYTRKGI